ncbi:hypothetical protein Mgra_00007917 [Meloidogyne graminicola]|uniref:Uncharacterized protein n=1 Tax=Meloidogyne graminicola TaxID=189291 RepID=A0A8S9ZHK5_9BILA|nr:hypothetical protein Mgra_00007917 [Meloidogyne graminicola]
MPAYNDEIFTNNTANINLGLIEDDSQIFQPKKSQKLDSQKFRSELLKNIDTFIFDADGVLWLGENAIAGSSSFIEYIAELGKKIIVLTNNATKSRAVYAKKLAGLGYGRYINEHNIVNPAAVVADLIHRSDLASEGKKVYLIGSQGVKDELKLLNIDYFGDGIDPVDAQPASKGQAFLYELELEEHPENVGAVVVGYEKYFNYLKLMKAANYLQNEDCLFLATNEDETCPGPNPETVIPDAGPLVAAVKTASGREPLTVGKPNTPAFEYICRRWGVDSIDPRRTLMIGDRVNTDVKFGRDHGLRTLLVLSGCHGLDEIEEGILQSRDDLVPEFYADCLGALIPKKEKNSTKKNKNEDSGERRKAKIKLFLHLTFIILINKIIVRIVTHKFIKNKKKIHIKLKIMKYMDRKN